MKINYGFDAALRAKSPHKPKEASEEANLDGPVLDIATVHDVAKTAAGQTEHQNIIDRFLNPITSESILTEYTQRMEDYVQEEMQKDSKISKEEAYARWHIISMLGQYHEWHITPREFVILRDNAVNSLSENDEDRTVLLERFNTWSIIQEHARKQIRLAGLDFSYSDPKKYITDIKKILSTYKSWVDTGVIEHSPEFFEHYKKQSLSFIKHTRISFDDPSSIENFISYIDALEGLGLIVSKNVVEDTSRIDLTYDNVIGILKYKDIEPSEIADVILRISIDVERLGIPLDITEVPIVASMAWEHLGNEIGNLKQEFNRDGHAVVWGSSVTTETMIDEIRHDASLRPMADISGVPINGNERVLSLAQKIHKWIDLGVISQEEIYTLPFARSFFEKYPEAEEFLRFSLQRMISDQSIDTDSRQVPAIVSSESSGTVLTTQE